jgi:hypothetical protein
MTSLTASIAAAGPASTVYRTVLAGLPNRYRLVEGAAEVMLVSGTAPGGAEQAIGGGVRGVVVDQPGRLSLEELMALEAVAHQHDCLVVPAPRYSPRLAIAPDLFDGAGVDLMESTITSRDAPRSSLVEQLAMVRQMLAPVATLRVLQSSTSHYVVEASVSGRPRTQVVLNGFVSSNGVEEASLHAIGIDRHLAVRIDAAPLGRPADISLADVSGRRSPWPVHQHAHRITLQGLHRLLTTGEGRMTYSPEDLREDLSLADALGTEG